MNVQTRETRFPRRMRLLIATTLAFAAAPVLAIEPFDADYQASYMGLQANARMSLDKQADNRWTYSLDLSGAGARMTQTTQFEADGDDWRPLSSVDTQRGESGLAAMLVKNRTVNGSYDWSKGVATWSGDVRDGRAGPVRLQPGDLDGMLMNLALVRDFASGDELSYRLVEEGRASRQAFRPAGSETINVQGREQRATKVVHRDGARTITAWIVEGLPVPARILQQRNGRDHIDLKLKSLR